MNRRNFLKGFLATATVVALAPLAPVVEMPVSQATFVSFEEIAAIVLNRYRRVVADAILDSGPRFKWEILYGQKCINGGNTLIEPIVYS